MSAALQTLPEVEPVITIVLIGQKRPASQGGMPHLMQITCRPSELLAEVKHRLANPWFSEKGSPYLEALCRLKNRLTA